MEAPWYHWIIITTRALILTQIIKITPWERGFPALVKKKKKNCFFPTTPSLFPPRDLMYFLVLWHVSSGVSVKTRFAHGGSFCLFLPHSPIREAFWTRRAVETWLCNISHSAPRKDAGHLQGSGGFSCLAEAPVVAID